MFKSRCDIKLNDVTEQAGAEKKEVRKSCDDDAIFLCTRHIKYIACVCNVRENPPVPIHVG